MSTPDVALPDPEEIRRSSSGGTFYRALLESLEPDDQQWVLVTVARQRAAERAAERSGDPLPRAVM